MHLQHTIYVSATYSLCICSIHFMHLQQIIYVLATYNLHLCIMFLYLQYINLHLYWQGPESSDTREHECRDLKWSDRDTLINKHPSLVASDPLRKTRPLPSQDSNAKIFKNIPKVPSKVSPKRSKWDLGRPWEPSWRQAASSWRNSFSERHF